MLARIPIYDIYFRVGFLYLALKIDLKSSSNKIDEVKSCILGIYEGEGLSDIGSFLIVLFRYIYYYVKEQKRTHFLSFSFEIDSRVHLEIRYAHVINSSQKVLNRGLIRAFFSEFWGWPTF